MESIRLLVVDIDGCLVPVEHEAYDLVRLTRVAELNQLSRHDPWVPPLTILSGRPHPYVDALMQILDIDTPAIFENGAGLATRSPYRASYRPEVGRGREALQLLTRELSSRGDVTIQPGKSASLTVFPLEPKDGIHWIEELLAEQMERHALDLITDPAQECVNVLVPGVDKGLGLGWLADELGVPLAQVAGMGDSAGDLAWLKSCGLSCAPANAVPEVRESVDRVSAFEDIEAVVELYESVIASNRAPPRQGVE